jgi:RNA polymerase sigma-B factor
VSFEDIYDQEQINQWLLDYKHEKNPKAKEQLRNFIVGACMDFVKKIAHGLARRSTDPIEDLIQVGSVGLLKAIDNYDASHGTSFKTYSTYLITGEIRHYLRDKIAMIRAPRELQELSYRVNMIVQRLTLDFGRAPSDLEIANQLAVPVKRIDEVNEIDRRKNMISLDNITSENVDNDQPLVDKLVDDNYQEQINRQEMKILLSEAIEVLDDELKNIIEMSFFDDMSQQQIADKMGVSQMQISRKIKKALSKLYDVIKNKEEIF